FVVPFTRTMTSRSRTMSMATSDRDLNGHVVVALGHRPLHDEPNEEGVRCSRIPRERPLVFLRPKTPEREDQTVTCMIVNRYQGAATDATRVRILFVRDR